MQELKVFAWCDVCHAEGGRGEALVSFFITISPVNSAGNKLGRPVAPRRLDLCDVHSKPVAEVVELLRHGTVQQAPKEPEPEAKPAPPPQPPKKGSTPAQKAWGRGSTECSLCGQTLTRHSMHGHLEGRHGAKPLSMPKKCPDCGKRFEVTQAMYTHRRKAHDYDSIAELVSRAKR